MKRASLLIFLVVFSCSLATAQEDRDPRLDIPGPEYSTRDLTVCQGKAADLLVRKSIDEYKAKGQPCACPYDYFRDGVTPCEGVSAYIRTNGDEPLCSRDDVDISDLNEVCPDVGT